MSLASFRCLFVFIAFAALVQVGICLECYTCSSPSSSVCGNEFSIQKVAALPCKSNENMCFKGSMTVLGVTVTTRACASDDPCQLLHDCSTCTENLCNSSSTITPSFMIFTIATVILVKLLM